MNDVVSPKVPLWRSKAVIIATIFSCLFLVFFYLAVNSEPDYMPSQKKTSATSQHQMNPSNQRTETSSESMQMSDQEMKNMQHSETHSEPAH